MFKHQRLRPACAFAQTDQSLCYSLEYSMTVKLMIERHLEFLSLKGGYTGSLFLCFLVLKCLLRKRDLVGLL